MLTIEITATLRLKRKITSAQLAFVFMFILVKKIKYENNIKLINYL